MLDPRTQRCKEQYEGKEFTTTDGNLKFIIKEFRAANDVTILFPESGLELKKSMYQINQGIPDPFGNSPVYFNDPLKALIGCVYPTNQGYFIEIIDAASMKEVMYRFRDEFGYVGVTTIQNIQKGEVRNPYHKNEFGGYLGVGPYTGNKRLYNIWHSMLVRGTGARDKYRKHYGKSQLYNNCQVCIDWLNYNKFADWYVKELDQLNPNYEYEIDKDLLYPLYRGMTNGMKLYSPATCCLIPHDVNLLLSDFQQYGSTNSKNSLEERVQFYYDDGAMTTKVYNAIKSIYFKDRNMNYIDDNHYNMRNFKAYRVDGKNSSTPARVEE